MYYFLFFVPTFILNRFKNKIIGYILFYSSIKLLCDKDTVEYNNEKYYIENILGFIFL